MDGRIKWTSDENQFVIDNYQTLTHKEIGEKLGKTTRCIKSKCQRDGLLTKTFCHKVNETYFDTWSPDMAWILGFTMADGNVANNEKASRYQLAYCIQQRDSEVVDFINGKLSPNKPFNYYRNVVTAKYTSSYMVDRLIELGVVERKTGKECVPVETPDEFFYDFLRGYWDGDGWVTISCQTNRSATVAICSSSKTVLDQIQERTGLGRVVNLAKWRPKGVDFYNWQVNKQSELKELYSRFYSNNGFRLERKYEVFDQYIKNIS